MITIATKRPVKYSDFKGKKKKTKTELTKEERRQKNIERARTLWEKGKQTGLLSAVENLAMGANRNLEENPSVQTPDVNLPAPEKGWKTYSTTKKAVIIGSVVVVLGTIGYIAYKKSRVK